MAVDASVWREIKASYAFVERNTNLSKRYWGWEITFLLYTVAQSASVIYIAYATPGAAGKHIDPHPFVLYLAIGALTWSYMANMFMAIAESVQWERWEGTIEYTMMAPINVFTYIIGSCLFGVLYGLVRTSLVLVALIFLFHLEANPAGLLPALAIVTLGSVSFIGLGIMAATLPLLFTEKGAQMTYVIEACLLLISGVYFADQRATCLDAATLAPLARDLRAQWHPGRAAQASDQYDHGSHAGTAGRDRHSHGPAGILGVLVGRTLRQAHRSPQKDRITTRILKKSRAQKGQRERWRDEGGTAASGPCPRRPKYVEKGYGNNGIQGLGPGGHERRGR